jgi:hypothetical protein
LSQRSISPCALFAITHPSAKLLAARCSGFGLTSGYIVPHLEIKTLIEGLAATADAKVRITIAN